MHTQAVPYSFILFLTLSLFPPSQLHAQGSAQGEWSPDVITDTLRNGLRIYFTHVNDIPLAEVSILVDAGTSREKEHEHGLSHLVANQLLKGSSDRDAGMISRRLDELGSVILPYAHYDFAQLYGKTLARNFRSTLEIMADAFVSPRFPSMELKKYQEAAPTAIPKLPSSTAEKASVREVQLLCGSMHPLTRPLMPDPADLEKFGRDDLARFHDLYYTPERSAIIISGDLDYRFVRTLLLEVFGRWQRGNAPAPLAPEYPSIDDRVVVLNDTAAKSGLAFVRMGVRTPPRDAVDLPALLVLNSILGDMDTSRIGTALWGHHVITPNFTTALGFSRDCGYLMMTASVSNGLVDSVLVITQQEVAKLLADGVSDAELRRAKSALLRDADLTFSSNRALLKLLKEAFVYALPLDEALFLHTHIAAVTRAQVQHTAEALFDDGLTTVVLGDGPVLQQKIQSAGREVLLEDVNQN